MPGRATTPPGWHDDPERPGTQRYWDGDQWTDGPQPEPDPAASPPTTVADESTGNRIATAGMVCAIVGSLFGTIPILFVYTLILGFLGISFGITGGRRIKRGETQRGKLMARTAIIVGVVAVVLGFVGAAMVNDALEDPDSGAAEIEQVVEGVPEDLRTA